MPPLFCLAGMKMRKPYYKKVNFFNCMLTINQNFYSNVVEEIAINSLRLIGLLVKLQGKKNHLRNHRQEGKEKLIY